MQFVCISQNLSLETKGLILMLLSAIFFSTMGCFLKLTAGDGYPSTELVFIRGIFQGVFVVIFMIIEHSDYDGENPQPLIKTPLGRSKREIPTVIFRGVMGGLNFIFKFYSIISLPLGDAITLFSLHPIITVFLAQFYLGENLRYSHIFAAFSTVVGATLMAGPSFLFNAQEADDNERNKLGYLAAFLGSICAASCLVLIRKAGKLGVYTSQLIFSFAFLGSGLALLLGLTVGIPLEGMWVLPKTKRSIWLMLAMCSVGGLGQLSLNYAGRISPAGLGSICRGTDILWGYVFEGIVFGQIPSLSTSIGVVFIIIALGTVAYEQVKEELSLMSSRKESSVEMEYRNIEEGLQYEKAISA